jgi:hypothetical protein
VVGFDEGHSDTIGVRDDKRDVHWKWMDPFRIDGQHEND